MITVADVWRGVLPAGTELIAGGSGLERRIEWATSLRTRPPAFDALKGGELAFIPVNSIHLLDDRLDLSQVMTSLAEKGGVAVAVLGDVSSDAIAVADRMMIPLLKLPGGASIPDVQHHTVRFILDQRTQLHERENELRLELTELALGGAGVSAICDRLAALTGCGVVWQDDEGVVLHRTGRVDSTDDQLRAASDEVHRWLTGVMVSAADPPVGEFEDGTRLLAPIPLRSGIGGYISIYHRQGSPQLARIGVGRAASASAIELDRDRAVLAALDDIEGDAIEAVLTGAYASEESVVERVRRLGADLNTAHAVVVMAPRARGSDVTGVAAAARKWVEQQMVGALVTVHGGRICVVAPQSTTDVASVVKDAQRLLDNLSGFAPSLELSGGIGHVSSGVAGIRTSHDQAVQAAAMGRRIHGGGRVVAFAQLGLYRLLSAMAGLPELREFDAEALGALRRYDQRTHAELIATLDAFFAAHGSPTEMAQRLHLHRNTVLYRLRRIEEVGAVDLSDPLARLSLHLALRAADVIDAGR